MRKRIGVMPEFAGFYDWMNAVDDLHWYSGFFAGNGFEVDVLLGRIEVAAIRNVSLIRLSNAFKRQHDFDESTSNINNAQSSGLAPR